MPLKLRYPEGVPLDDLEPMQKYRIAFRGPAQSITGELRELLLCRGLVPRITILPDGKPHCVSVPINKIAAITVAEVDLSNSDYRDEDPDDYGCAGR